GRRARREDTGGRRGGRRLRRLRSPLLCEALRVGWGARVSEEPGPCPRPLDLALHRQIEALRVHPYTAEIMAEPCLGRCLRSRLERASGDRDRRRLPTLGGQPLGSALSALAGRVGGSAAGALSPHTALTER